MAATQMSLDLGRSPQPEIFYFALRPNIGAARAMVKIARWCRERHGLSARLYGADRLHVSLAPAVSRRGARKDDVAAAFRAAMRVRAAPFVASFGRLCTFAGCSKHPVVLCCDDAVAGLAELRRSLQAELVKAGLWRGPVHFRPHVTLFWARCHVPDVNLEEPIRWTVEDFVLVQSMIGRSHHIDLAQWPLKPR